MPPVPSDPSSSFVSTGGELHLSNLGQLELLRGMVERGVPLRTPVRGFSMRPFILDGDVLTIAPLAGRRPEVGDVVAFIQPETGRLAIHRVVSRTSEGWVLRGDNCAEADGLVPEDHLLARVVAVERDGRFLRLGLGAERTFVGLLNRGRAWTLLKAAGRIPLRAAGLILRGIQSLPIYRSVGRRLAPGVNISLAGEKDLAAVRRHFNPGRADRDSAPNPNVMNWVARRRAGIIGFVQYVHYPQSCPEWAGHWLFSLEVWRTYRGMGLGEKLTYCVIEQAMARGADELWLVVKEDNLRAIRLYQKLGFEIIVRPALEPMLEAERKLNGKRRIAMRKSLRRDP